LRTAQAADYHVRHQRKSTLPVLIIAEGGPPVLKKLLIASAAAAMVIAVSAVAQQPAIKRTPLQTVDFPSGYNVVSAIAEVAPGNCAGRHTHPGVESTYVMEGAVLLKIAGQPDRVVKAGESFQVPPNIPHDGCTVPGAVFKVLATYIVEKGKPLATPAPE
jgi:quercetin dioxygenase-like cupin family protein